MSRVEVSSTRAPANMLDALKREPSPEVPTGEAGLGPLVGHYSELFRQNLRLILTIVLIAALFSGLYAVYKLNFSPVFRATAKVTVQPTDAELRFTQVYVRSSSYDSANVVTRSHIEYLKSREIAERAHGIIWGTQGTVPDGPDDPALLAAAKSAKDSVTGTLKWLNSGAPAVIVPEGSVDDRIAEIQDAIQLRMIESSFVMEISVLWDDPEIAAKLANVLAVVYQERSREQIAAASSELTRFLEQQKADAERRLKALLDERNGLRQSTGIVDLGVESTEILARLFREQTQLDADRRDLGSARAIVETFLPASPELRFDGLSQDTKDRVNQARLRMVELQNAIITREQVVTDLEARLARLSGQEARFERLNSEIERVRTQLDDIDGRLLSVRMNQAEGIETLRVIDFARAPAFPDEPKVLKQTGLGAFSGLFLAIMLVLARDFSSARVRTQSDLAEVVGVKVLGPIRLDKEVAVGADRRAAPQDAMRPFLGWYEFDTDEPVSVLDVSDDERAGLIADLVVDHYPYNDKVHSGLLGLAPRPGYLPRPAAVLITMGRGEMSGTELGELIARLLRYAPGTPVAVSFVEGRLPQDPDRGEIIV